MHTLHAGARLGFLNSSALFPHAAAPDCIKVDPKLAHVPPLGYGLSPMALGNQTGIMAATTDRLIVASRHSDVSPSRLLHHHGNDLIPNVMQLTVLMSRRQHLPWAFVEAPRSEAPPLQSS